MFIAIMNTGDEIEKRNIKLIGFINDEFGRWM